MCITDYAILGINCFQVSKSELIDAKGKIDNEMLAMIKMDIGAVISRHCKGSALNLSFSQPKQISYEKVLFAIAEFDPCLFLSVFSGFTCENCHSWNDTWACRLDS